MAEIKLTIDFRLSEASRREINRRLYLLYHTLNRAHFYGIDDLIEVEVKQEPVQYDATG